MNYLARKRLSKDVVSGVIIPPPLPLLHNGAHIIDMVWLNRLPILVWREDVLCLLPTVITTCLRSGYRRRRRETAPCRYDMYLTWFDDTVRLKQWGWRRSFLLATVITTCLRGGYRRRRGGTAPSGSYMYLTWFGNTVRLWKLGRGEVLFVAFVITTCICVGHRRGRGRQHPVIIPSWFVFTFNDDIAVQSPPRLFPSRCSLDAAEIWVAVSRFNTPLSLHI